MDKSTIEKWEKENLWSEGELQELCCGLTPNGARPNTEELNSASEAIRRAVLSKALPCVCPSDATAGDKLYGHARFFRPDDAIRWAAPKFPQFPFVANCVAVNHTKAKPQDAGSLGERAETTYLHIIAALLECIAGNLPKVEKHPSFSSEAKLIEAIDEHFKGFSGLSKSNLSRKFPEAKRTLSGS